MAMVKVPDVLIGVIIGVLLAYLIARVFNLGFRRKFVAELKQEPLDVQAQYKIVRIKSLLETYD